MKVFKFGGASVKDADAIRNAVNILKSFNNDKIVLIVSAMGKMTNAFEQLHQSWIRQDVKIQTQLDVITTYHLSIALELFPKQHSVFSELETLYNEIREIVSEKTENYNFDESYDKLIPYGEILSTIILQSYCQFAGINSLRADARSMVITDSTFREGRVNWEMTCNAIHEKLKHFLSNSNLSVCITQGFIGTDINGKTVTLGREGSDFSAAVFAYALNANEVTIWKDVPGLYNADPKQFAQAVLLPHVSYHEAVELAYYGQSIIHPKTIKPLQNKNIPLYIRSFIDKDTQGSVIDSAVTDDSTIPSFILKHDQMLVSLSTRDFSFINEENLEYIFAALHRVRIRINMMQNSALSFSFCADFNKEKLDNFISETSALFSLRYNTSLELITVRNYNEEIVNELTKQRHVLMEQRSRVTIQLVTEKKN